VGTDEDGAPWQWQFTAPNGSGYYQFYVSAIDNLLQRETPYPPNETTEPKALLSVSYNHTFNLYYNATALKGWNYFCVPVKHPGIVNASDLIDYINGFSPDTCTMVAHWDPILQQYKTHVYIPGIGHITETDFPLAYGEGLNVYVTETLENLYIEGCLIEYDEINLTLYIGYNMIGWPNLENTTAEQLGENITDCIKVGNYNATGQWYPPEYFIGSPIEPFNITIGEAVFIFRYSESHSVTPISWIGGRDFLTLPPP